MFINYCNTVWGQAPKAYLDKLFILQKRMLRIINHVRFRDHTEHLFTSLQIMNIYQINKCLCYSVMFKHIKGMLPVLFIIHVITQVSN